LPLDFTRGGEHVEPLRVFDRAMSPSTMPFGPELTAEGLRTLRFSKGSVEW